MPNIELHGMQRSDANSLKAIIDELMKKIGRENDAVTDIYNDLVQTCNGGHKNAPYIRILTTDFRDIVAILDIFEKNKTIHVDVEIPTPIGPNGLFFFEADQIASGEWRDIVDKRVAIIEEKGLEFLMGKKES